jgi:hypothetical protein
MEEDGHAIPLWGTLPLREYLSCSNNLPRTFHVIISSPDFAKVLLAINYSYAIRGKPGGGIYEDIEAGLPNQSLSNSPAPDRSNSRHLYIYKERGSNE